jgi:hypothetical protein
MKHKRPIILIVFGILLLVCRVIESPLPPAIFFGGGWRLKL